MWPWRADQGRPSAIVLMKEHARFVDPGFNIICWLNCTVCTLQHLKGHPPHHWPKSDWPTSLSRPIQLYLCDLKNWVSTTHPLTHPSSCLREEDAKLNICDQNLMEVTPPHTPLPLHFAWKRRLLCNIIWWMRCELELVDHVPSVVMTTQSSCLTLYWMSSRWSVNIFSPVCSRPTWRK